MPVTAKGAGEAGPPTDQLEMVGNYGEMEEQNQKLDQALEAEQAQLTDPSMNGHLKRLLWHGGSVYDAWFSAASNQVGAPDHQLNCKHIAAAELEVHVCLYMYCSKQAAVKLLLLLH
jgi:uncharacterized damage-inducible protein DinB